MKRICKVYSLNDRNRIQNNLNNHNIHSTVKTKGPNIFQRVPDKAVWFVIYINKNDYETAKSVIKGLPKGDFEKELDLF